MGVFSNAQGQLTPQSVVKSWGISKSSEILWLSSIPARMKKIRSKMKTLECNKIICHFSDAQGQLTPKSLVEFCRKFELIQAFIVVLVTCTNEEDPIKNEGGRVLTSLLFDFSDAQSEI